MPRRSARRDWFARAVLLFAGAIAIHGALAPRPAAAQAGMVEATYVVLGGEGAIARAILTGTGECPAITLDGATQRMGLRARPDDGAAPAFPDLVCETLIAPGTRAATINGRALPLPRDRLASVAALGDTGCRLKAAQQQTTRDHDHPHPGKFQDCDRPSQWPFARLSRTAAAQQPDLVIHVGDYIYRESPCPPGDKGCKGSPYGDNWRTWRADFFAPARPLLAAAPWIVVRGNHESCRRAGVGYFRFLYPALAQGGAPPACTDSSPPYTAQTGGRSFIVMDSTSAVDDCATHACDSAPYAAQFASFKPTPGTWFLTHRPIWGIGRNFTLNETLQRALAEGANGRLPAGIDLALSGHMHIFEALSFSDDRPPQLVVGTGGTALDRPVDRKLQGMTLGSATVGYGRSEHRFGFLMIAPNGARASARFIEPGGRTRFTCALMPIAAKCD